MLVAERRQSESFMIGHDLMITVLEIEVDRAQIELSHKIKLNRITFFDPVRATWLEPGQSFAIADGIVCTLVLVKDEKVRLGFNAPKGMRIHRKEVYEAISRAT